MTIVRFAGSVLLVAAVLPGSVGEVVTADESSHAAAIERVTQVAELSWPGELAKDNLGWSVGLSGTTIVVGAPGYDSGAGRAFVFTKGASGWRRRAELDGPGIARGDAFGDGVAVSGNTIVATASGAHRAFVFTRTSAGWHQSAELRGSGSSALKGFGDSVAMSNGTAVVGGLGSAFVFTKGSSSWHQSAVLKGSDSASSDGFGVRDIAISDDTIVVGGPGHASSSGRAYVFTSGVGVWRQTAELGANSAPEDFFGAHVAISGSTIAVSSSNMNHFLALPVVYVFSRGAIGWRQIAELQTPMGLAGAVGVSGSTVVAGSVGKVVAFNVTKTRSQDRAELEGSDTGVNDYFGMAVAISGNTVVVGAYGYASGSGRAYVFNL